jgi:hypothetical protein
MQIQRINRDDYEKIYIIVKAENALVAGDIVQWSDTASTTYPLGIAVEDSVAGSGRIAGVVVDAMAAGDYGRIQIYGYNTNITTDGAVASADLWLTAGAAVAVGKTATELNGSISTPDYATLTNTIGWNITADSGTVGQGFIRLMGNL